jgi:hypothetical protein
MADPVQPQRRSGADTAILLIVVLAVVALLVWFIIGRGGADSDGVDIDVEVPGQIEGAPGGQGR